MNIYKDNWNKYFKLGLFPFPASRDGNPIINWESGLPTFDILRKYAHEHSKCNLLVKLGDRFVVIVSDSLEAEAFLKSLNLPPSPISTNGEKKLIRWFKLSRPVESIKAINLEVRTGSLGILGPPSLDPETGKPHEWTAGLSPWDLPFPELPQEAYQKIRAFEGKKKQEPEIIPAQVEIPGPESLEVKQTGEEEGDFDSPEIEKEIPEKQEAEGGQEDPSPKKKSEAMPSAQSPRENQVNSSEIERDTPGKDDERGWIKLWRKTLDSEIFANPHLFKLWIYCLLTASHKEMFIPFSDLTQPIKIEPGQFITGRYALHEAIYPKRSREEWRELRKGGIRPDKLVSAITLWRNFKELEKMGNIKCRNVNNRFSLVTVINWHIYQGDTSEFDQPVINRRSTDDQPMITNKNDKNEKNIYRAEALEVLSYLNEKTRRHYRDASKIEARLKDGGTKEQCKQIIDRKMRDEYFLNNPKYLNPETLFRKSHWDKYLNEPDSPEVSRWG